MLRATNTRRPFEMEMETASSDNPAANSGISCGLPSHLVLQCVLVWTFTLIWRVNLGLFSRRSIRLPGLELLSSASVAWRASGGKRFAKRSASVSSILLPKQLKRTLVLKGPVV